MPMEFYPGADEREASPVQDVEAIRCAFRRSMRLALAARPEPGEVTPERADQWEFEEKGARDGEAT
jgi:hypothetical protein